MGVVAKTGELLDAQVAASALRAAGFRAEVFDHHYGAMNWAAQSALGGFRIMAPDEELADAQAFLAGIKVSDGRRRRQLLSRGFAWRAMAVLFGAFVHPYAGWLVVALRRRRRPSLGAFDAALISLAISALTVGLGYLLAAAPFFLDRWLIHPRLD